MLKRFLHMFARLICPEEVGNDIIIVVMGPAGAGKSTFINTATAANKMHVEHSLGAYSRYISSIECTYPGDEDGRSIVFVDTPSIDYDSHTATDVENQINKWLERTYPRRTHVDGILFLYKISSNRATEAMLPSTYTKTFSTLLGADYQKKLLIVTTMWNSFNPSPPSPQPPSRESSSHSRCGNTIRENVMKENTMKENKLKASMSSVIKGGFHMERFEQTIESAWRAVDILLSRHPDLHSAMSRSPDIGDVTEEHIIIAVMGQHGAGKSSFINTITTSSLLPVSTSLTSCTHDLSIVKFRCYDRSDLDIIFIDTPGCDSVEEVRVVLERVELWLRTCYKRNVKPTAILWLHRIVDNWLRPSGIPHYFKRACAEKSINNLAFVTTMWDEYTPSPTPFSLSPDPSSSPSNNVDSSSSSSSSRSSSLHNGTSRFKNFSSSSSPRNNGLVHMNTPLQLKNDPEQWERDIHTRYWKPLIDRGLKTYRYQNTPESGWEILNDFCMERNTRYDLELQREMVGLQKRLCDDECGGSRRGADVFARLRGFISKEQGIIRQMRSVASRPSGSVSSGYGGGGGKDGELLPLRLANVLLQKQIHLTVEEIKTFGVPIGKHLSRLSSRFMEPEGKAIQIFPGEDIKSIDTSSIRTD